MRKNKPYFLANFLNLNISFDLHEQFFFFFNQTKFHKENKIKNYADETVKENQESYMYTSFLKMLSIKLTMCSSL